MLPLVQHAAVAFALITGVGATLMPTTPSSQPPTVSPPRSESVAVGSSVTPTTETVPLAGVDAGALAQLRQEVEGAPPALPAGAAATLEQDPGAAEQPAVLTDPMDTDQFTLAAVTWDLDRAPSGGVTVDLRLREDGTWSDWQRLDSGETTDPAAGDVVADGTEPLLTGGADGVQVRVDTPENEVPGGLRLVLVDGGESPHDSAPAAAPETAGMVQTSVVQPAIITRSQWGADESLRNGSVSTSAAVRGITVHHTAGTNNYTAENTAAQVRSVYAYHTASLGWSDIGYNFLVDRFGRVYEGRAGSLTQAVMGAHAGGFNSDTMGVSALGNYEVAAAPPALVDAIGRVAGWKLSQYGVDPAGTVRLTSAGGGTAKYGAGVSVTLPAVFAHRQVGSTACPGVNLYAQMSTIRSVAARAMTPEPVFGPGAVPVVGDLDGNGFDELGWFRNGQWAFRTAGGSVVKFALGTAGDVPVMGDWDGDGEDDPGVFRKGTWFLRNSATTGQADRWFAYGSSNDIPLVGRWAGQDQDGIAVVRGNAWYTRRTVTPGPHEHLFRFGVATDRPVLGAWLDDGTARPGVVRGNVWHLSTSIQRPSAAYVFGYGSASDRFVVADWDGNGDQNPTAVRGDSFFVRKTLSNPAATVVSFEG